MKYINLSSRAGQSILLKELKKYGIGNTEYPILLYLAFNENIGQNELGRAIHMNKSLVTKSVKNLEKNLYINIKRCDKNKSKKLLCLTEKGKNLIPKITNEIEILERKIFNKFSDDEKNIIMMLLKKIYNNIIELKEEES